MARAGEPIEKLYVSIEADIKPLLQQTKDGVDQVERKLDDMSDTGQQSFDSMAKSVVGYVAKLKLVQWAIQTVTSLITKMVKIGINAFKNLTKAGISVNAQFEIFTAQFETLLGSAEAAQQRIKELTEFAIATPFELPGIIEASRVLQVFGGDLLATGENLTMVGDIAAGVHRDFASVALWIGRAYDAMQSGQPFGMAGLALQRMGAMTGEARRELEEMQKEGASGTEMWERFREVVGTRFAGDMERLSGTFLGVTSNIKDLAEWLMRIGGEESFTVVRDAALELFTYLEEHRPELESIAIKLGEVATALAETVGGAAFDFIKSIDFQDVENFAGSLWTAAENLRTFVEIMLVFIDESDAVSLGLQAMEFSARGFANIMDFINVATVRNISATTTSADTMERLSQALADHAARLEEHRLRQEESTEATDDNTEALKRYAAWAAAAATAAAKVAAAEAKVLAERLALMDMAENFAEQMIDEEQRMNEQLEELRIAHGEKLLAITARYNERVVDLDRKYQERRAEIAAKAEEKLADLASDTAEQRAEITEDYHTRQRRAKEDFDREMTRLHFRYMDSLVDAIKNRDARAIVDLRRQHKREVKERTEDFGTRGQREREDYENRLRELAENEQQRRQEIQESQARQLRDLQESHNRQLAEAAQAHVQQVAQENTSYAKRQAELSRALARRLQTITRGLADEEKLNKEGARRILEALNETFGVGGNIDRLMEDFAARRRQKMIVRVTFEPDTPAVTPQTAPAAWAGDYQHGGTVVARRPTMALFGEAGPEMATFTPLSAGQNNMAMQKTLNLNLNLSGSAPPGIRSADRDAIAGVLLSAIRDAGWLR